MAAAAQHVTAERLLTAQLCFFITDSKRDSFTNGFIFLRVKNTSYYSCSKVGIFILRDFCLCRTWRGIGLLTRAMRGNMERKANDAKTKGGRQ